MFTPLTTPSETHLSLGLIVLHIDVKFYSYLLFSNGFVASGRTGRVVSLMLTAMQHLKKKKENGNRSFVVRLVLCPRLFLLMSLYFRSCMQKCRKTQSVECEVLVLENKKGIIY